MKKIICLFLLILFLQTSEAVEFKHHYNPYSNIVGMYYLDGYGLIFSSSLGFFKYDEESGEVIEIKNLESNYVRTFTRFFMYQGELHFYEPNMAVHKLTENGFEKVVGGGIVEHVVYDDKMYLLKDLEPRLVIYDGNEELSYQLSSSNGTYAYSSMIEAGGKIYAQMFLNYSGESFLYEISGKEVNKIAGGIGTARLYNIDSEAWLSTGSSTYRIADSKIELLSGIYPFRDDIILDMHYFDERIFGINRNGIFLSDYNTGNTEMLLEGLELNYSHKAEIIRKGNLLTFRIVDEIYQYDLDTEEFTKFERIEDTYINAWTFDEADKVIIANKFLIEWYKDEVLKLEGNGVLTNEFYDIEYDHTKNEIVAAGIFEDKYILQKYDGHNWTYQFVDTITHRIYENSYYDLDLVIDNNGSYYISADDYLGYYDGEKWKRISLLIDNPDDSYVPRESYDVLLRDSTGQVWLRSLCENYSEHFNNYFPRSAIGVLNNGEYEEVHYLTYFGINETFAEGICTSDGKIIFNSVSADRICYDCAEEINLMNPEDGEELYINNTNRKISSDRNGNMVVAFGSCTLFRQSGTYSFVGSIGKFDGESWAHKKYTELMLWNYVVTNGAEMVYDTEGDEYFVTKKNLIKVTNKKEGEAYPYPELYFDFFEICTIKNKVWLASTNLGILSFELPFETSVAENDNEANYLLKSFISNGLLELSSEVEKFQVYDILGNLLKSGANKTIVDISDLPSGTYIAKFKINNQVLSRKFLVVK